MMKRTCSFVAGLVAFAALLACPAALADSPARPSSYTAISPNEKYLFVMIAPMKAEDEAADWIDEKAAEILAIRKKYTQSGLYLNDGSTKPLWTVDWYSYEVEVA